ncbi:hypothetical protein [Butyrivibrio sp. WCD3002]|uniref:hypothetical protein n=1 Tax=Butyrivibrio sp. WCD3002 TaxID=1280676 RepID=UPI000426F8D2|nr:hypothetical protein [Butyrivibrio sp. WCD3002]
MASPLFWGLDLANKGNKSMGEAKDTLNNARSIYDRAMEKYQHDYKYTVDLFDDIGKKELRILSSFESFSDLFETIQTRPEFQGSINIENPLTRKDFDSMIKASKGASMLLDDKAIGSVGATSCFALCGVVEAAFAAINSAMCRNTTGSKKETLTREILVSMAKNTILAVGGSGIMAIEPVIIIGGIINNVIGLKMSKQANEAYQQAIRVENEVEEIHEYLGRIDIATRSFRRDLSKIGTVYEDYKGRLNYIINIERKREWEQFNDDEKRIAEITAKLVAALYKMLKVQIVTTCKNDATKKEVNKMGINELQFDTNEVLGIIG